MKARVLAACLLVAGCASLNGPKQSAGTFVGAGAGALAGSQFGKGDGKLVAVAIGTLLGAMVGSEIGASMDERDRQMATNAFYRSANSNLGTTVNWNNPRTQNHGNFRAVRDGVANDGRYCREFITEVYVDGRAQRSSEIACRNANGQWRFI